MNISILEKILIIFKYFVSNFLALELFIVGLLLICFLVINSKVDNKIVKRAIPIFTSLVIVVIIIYQNKFFINSIKSFIKSMMYYYYFPNLALYLVIVIVALIIFIITIFKDLDKRKKLYNYITFAIIFSCFIQIIGYISLNDIKLTLGNGMYRYEVIMSFVQISNLVSIIWIIVTSFIYLYKYFKTKFD